MRLGSSKTPSSWVMISEKAQIVPGAPTTFVYLAFPVLFFPAGVYRFTHASYPPGTSIAFRYVRPLAANLASATAAPSGLPVASLDPTTTISASTSGNAFANASSNPSNGSRSQWSGRPVTRTAGTLTEPTTA